jgi:hypothetical protein
MSVAEIPSVDAAGSPAILSLHPDANDALALAYLVARNPIGIELVYDRWAGMLYTLALRLVGESRVAEQIVMNAFLELWRSPEVAIAGHVGLLRYLSSRVLSAARAERADRG